MQLGRSVERMRVSEASPEVVSAVLDQVRAALEGTSRRPVVVGLCGAQGSGKSTLARAVVTGCEREGWRAAALSLDDLYLTRAERHLLARDIHPLLATRGVPGTHDVPLGLSLLAALETGASAPLPRFSKAEDDRAPRRAWPLAPAHCEVLVFEGWCLGARPQPVEALATPVNALEAEEDADGRWRGYVNTALAGAYQSLFVRVDRLILLAAPDFAIVREWRLEQERELARRRGGGSGIMDEAGIERFIAHFERLTRYILDEMPARADLVVELDAQRRPKAMHARV